MIESAHCDASTANDRGYTALDVALQREHRNMIELLRKDQDNTMLYTFCTACAIAALDTLTRAVIAQCDSRKARKKAKRTRR